MHNSSVVRNSHLIEIYTPICGQVHMERWYQSSLGAPTQT